jgi:pantetheine-phosphate adenylyltransferase
MASTAIVESTKRHETRRCIYAGSFDPLTNGHLWMIHEGAKLFDHLVVAVGVNAAKRTVFSSADRVGMIREAVRGLANVEVDEFSQQFLADYARQKGCRHILRGIRQESDYEYERGMRYLNEGLNPDLTTVFLIPPRDLVETSSSLIKSLIGPVGWEFAVRPFLPASVYRGVLVQELERAFQEAWQADGCSAGEARGVFKELIDRHSEDGRHYHDLSHLAALVSELDATSGVAPEWRVRLIWAIFFHDVIYNPQASDNEERSADLWIDKAGVLGLSESTIRWVDAVIRATKRHELPGPDHPVLRQQPDGLVKQMMSLFLDMDLAILGAKPGRFDWYEEAISQEYAWVPKILYTTKRRSVIGKFLSRPRLFLTDSFAKRYEEQARLNLARVVGS